MIYNGVFERDVWMQIVAFILVMVGYMGLYFGWKTFGNKSKITLRGIIKKFVVAVFAGLLFIAFNPWIDVARHRELIIPCLTWGFSAEAIVGAFIQQKVEAYVATQKSKPKKEIVEETEAPKDEKKDDKKDDKKVEEKKEEKVEKTKDEKDDII